MKKIHPLDWSINGFLKRLGMIKSPAFNELERRTYLEFLKPRDKKILDVGAFDGDTARLFLKAGASKVFAVEKDLELAARIRLPHVEVFAEPFDPEKHLGLPWDAMKMDIEGYEVLLLPYLDSINKPIIIESHNWYITEQFMSKGFKILTKPNPMCGLCLMGRDT